MTEAVEGVPRHAGEIGSPDASGGQRLVLIKLAPPAPAPLRVAAKLTSQIGRNGVVPFR